MTQILARLRRLDGQHFDSTAENATLSRVHHLELHHGRRIRERDIVNLEPDSIFGRERHLRRERLLRDLVGGPEYLLPSPRAVLYILRLGCFKRGVQHSGDPAPPRAEVHIARTQRKAIRFPARRLYDDMRGQHEVADHVAYHDRLLNVLLPKVHALGLHNVEELHTDRRHATEERRPGRTLENLADGGDADKTSLGVNLLAREAGRVHLGGGRSEDGADAAQVSAVVGELAVEFGEDLAVRLPRRRVAGEVLLNAKLRWVDVNADDDVVGLPRRGADEGQMALVQGTHGGHEPDNAVVEDVRLAPAPDSLDGA